MISETEKQVITPKQFDVRVRFVMEEKLVNAKSIAKTLGISDGQLSKLRTAGNTKQIRSVYPIFLEKFNDILGNFNEKEFLISENNKPVKEDTKEILKDISKRLDEIQEKTDAMYKYTKKIYVGTQDEFKVIDGVTYRKFGEQEEKK